MNKSIFYYLFFIVVGSLVSACSSTWDDKYAYTSFSTTTSSFEEKVYSVIGDFNGDNWTTDYVMEKGTDGRLYVTIDGLKRGDYKFKIRVNHDWDENYGADAEKYGKEVWGEILSDNASLNIAFDAETYEIRNTYYGVKIDEIDWTDKSKYYETVDYDKDHARVSVVYGQGLIIESDPPENADDKKPYVPIIIDIPSIKKGDVYLVKFTLDAPTAGEISLDLCSWGKSGATSVQKVIVGAGVNDYLIEFDKYPTTCNSAKVLYQCGKLPGKHVMKKVQVYRYR